MATTSVQVRMDNDLKKQADRVLEDIGLDMPTALRLFLKKVVRTKSIPFRVSATARKLEFTPAAGREILASVARIKADPSQRLGKFSDAKALIKSLKK